MFGANGISIKVKLCIQNKLPYNTEETALPAITEPNILQAIRAFTKNTAYVIKPYIGQRKEHKNTGKHYMDITYVKRIRAYADNHTMPSDENYIFAISDYFASAVSTRSNIHPIVLFLFDKIDDLYKYETQLAIFENSLGAIAYVYAGIIEDADYDIFQNDSAKDNSEKYVPLNAIGVKGSGVYIFRQSIAPPEEPDSFRSCIAAHSIDEIDRYEYTNTVNRKKSETLHGLYALTEQLRHELRKYNLLVDSKSLNEMVSKFDDII